MTIRQPPGGRVTRLRRLLLGALGAAVLLSAVAMSAHAALAPCIPCSAPNVTLLTGPATVTKDVQGAFTFKASHPDVSFTCSWRSPDGTWTDPSACGRAPSFEVVSAAHPSAPLTEGTWGVRVGGCKSYQWNGSTETWCDTSPAEYSWRVDRTKPVLSFTAGTPAEGAHVKRSFLVGWDTSEPIDYSWCLLDGEVMFGSCGTSTELTWGSDGPRTLEVVAVDAADNLSETIRRTFVVDSIAPVVSFTGGPSAATKDARPTAAFAATDADAVLAVACKLTGPGGTATTPCSDGSWTPAAELADGAYVLEVTKTDRAGNAGQATRAFTVDRTAPSLGAIAWDAATRKASFASEGGATLTCALGGAAFVPCTSPVDASGLAPGSHPLVVRATDAAGNAAERSAALTIPAPVTSPATGTGPPATTPGSTPSSGAAPTSGTTPTLGSTPASGGPAPGGSGTSTAPGAPLAGVSQQAVAEAFGFVASTTCQAKRSFRVRLRAPRGIAILRVRVSATGAKASVAKRGGRYVARISAIRAHRRTITVRLQVTTVSGRTLKGARTYRTCVRRG